MSSGQLSRRAFLGAFALGTSAALLSACGAPATPAVAPTAPAAKPAATSVSVAGTAPAASGQPKSGGTLTAGKLGDVANLDGHYWSPNAGLHVWLAYDTLARYDANFKPQPQLAESWEVSSDLKQITVNLRKGVTFHSGREFTADDVVWNLQRALNPKVTVGIITGFFGQDPTFTAKDKYTVVLQTAQPWPTVFDMFHVVNMLDKENTDVASNAQTKAVGTGPFVFQEWRQGESMRKGKCRARRVIRSPGALHHDLQFLLRCLRGALWLSLCLAGRCCHGARCDYADTQLAGFLEKGSTTWHWASQ